MITLVCCGKHSNDENLIQDAQSLIESGNYSQAIDKLSNVNNVSELVVQLRMTAYAGLAGFKLFQVYDSLYAKKDITPKLSILFYLAKSYSDTEINAARSSVQEIESFQPVIEQRSNDLNMRFSFIEIYKVSQILLHYSDLNGSGLLSKDWNPCLEGQFPLKAATEIIISLNKAITALNLVKSVYTEQDLSFVYDTIQKIQLDSGINPIIQNENQIQNSDVVTLRSYLYQKVLEKNGSCN